MVVIACVGSIGTALATSGAGQQPTTVAATAFATSSSTDDLSVAMVATVVNLDGHEYPAVVARVDGEAISGKVLAQRVYGIEHAGPGAPTVADPIQTALNGLIQDTVLRQAARRHGITVTDAEIQAFQKSQQQAFAAAGPEAMKLLQVQAEYQGDKSIAAYWADPTTIAAERDALMIGKMRQKIFQQELTETPVPATHEQAIAQFVAAQHSQVEIYITP